ncbi:MAG TPA: tRNA 2-selenouridine(34) synthase MnmH [Casimicrobiaceae bacterium]|nr:tRNA 2-selenouridine(34) synthase MnmH [Casimicrobiaceae bacterium]
MNERHVNAQRVGVGSLADYADRIDVRSPAEFALDHIPGATNHPVLDNEERSRIGTLYASSPFAARRMGAAVVARNIARTLETAFADKPREWCPLVYCWRGGQRSRALVHVLNEIGWHAKQLDGGYRQYRRHVVAQLAALPARYDFAVISGLTGSGKSRLLAALGAAGAQTLDLEALAHHRGSLLGDLPDAPQPSQKWFESRLYAALEGFQPERPVFVESESRRIGALQLPDALLESMHRGRRLLLVTALAQRVELLKRDYGHFVADATRFRERLAPLAPLHGKATLSRWEALASAGDWDALVTELLEQHYDPTYARSLGRYPVVDQPPLRVEVHDISDEGFAALARDVLAAIEAAEAATAGAR